MPMGNSRRLVSLFVQKNRLSLVKGFIPEMALFRLEPNEIIDIYDYHTFSFYKNYMSTH